MQRNHYRASAAAGFSVSAAIFSAVLYFVLLGVLGVLFQAARLVLVAAVVTSAVTLLAYRSDKRAAKRGRWRTQESTLHLMALAGGWPGALVAQRLFRHKTRKQPFQAIFWFTVICNLMITACVIVTTA